MSGGFPDIAKELEKNGFEIIYSENLDCLYDFESQHIDIQCLKINDTIFIHKDSVSLKAKLKSLGYKVIFTEKSLKKKYPENIILNGAYVKGKLYCHEKAIDNSVKKYCVKNNIEIVNVKQGYAKCSTAIIGDAIITSDKGIYSAMTQGGVEGLLIESGNIDLVGVDYGFIGGCCFCCNDNVYFTGNIKLHPNYIAIENFCKKQNKNIICLSGNKLYDIGGFIVV